MRLFFAALIVMGATAPAATQWLDRPWPGIPRTADGEPNLMAPAPRGPDGKPDLTGVWDAPSAAARPDPANLQPWVLDLAREYQQDYYKARPLYQCLPSGPEAERFGYWKRFLQTPTALAILNEDLTYRVIHTDGRELEADPAPSWMGYSAGRWDGDTLVVESGGFNEKTWASRYGVVHTEALRITERYRRPDFGHLQVEVTFTDPGAYVKPWGFTVTMTLAADTEMLEAICERSSNDWAGSLSETESRAVSVLTEVLAGYVGSYTGIYGGSERTYEVSLSDGQLFANIVGTRAEVEGGLAAGGLDAGSLRPLVPLSQTLFEGLGLGYRFIVDDDGVATDLVVIHISGPYTYPRER